MDLRDLLPVATRNRSCDDQNDAFKFIYKPFHKSVVKADVSTCPVISLVFISSHNFSVISEDTFCAGCISANQCCKLNS